MSKMKKRALITGINGMDGSHLADFLIEKDYQVFGLERRSSIPSRQNISHVLDKITLIQGDLTDKSSLERALKIANPDEVYNLAAQSFVGASWNLSEQTTHVNALGVLYMLESIRSFNEKIRFFQAGTSEMFGSSTNTPQHENTRFYPRSPYGVSKLYGHWITKNFRESYRMYACNGILFNHESERRGIDFVTRKITDGVAKIHLGIQDHITLGNLDVKRDWGYAPDYVEAMWLMMQQDEEFFFNHDVGDFVISSGECHSVKDFLDRAFKVVGIENWSSYVKQDPRFMRPAEADVLLGDPSKAANVLGWKRKVGFDKMVELMVKNDIKLNKSKNEN